MGCVQGKNTVDDTREGAYEDGLKGQHSSHHNDAVDILTSDSDGLITETVVLPIRIPGRDSKAGSMAGSKAGSEASTPKLLSENGTLKVKRPDYGTPKGRSQNGTPKLRSESGTPKMKGETFLTPKVKADSGSYLSDTPHQMGSNRRKVESPLLDSLDLDAGLSRLSHLSDQYLHANGSRVVKVPSGGFDLRFSYLTQRGYYPEALDKANQDSFCAHTMFGDNPNDHFFGVFDGHGEFGTHCSQFVKKHLCENLLRNRHFQADAVQAFHGAFGTTNMQLHRFNIDDSMSGTTGITVLVRGRTLYVANVGDSRAIIAERKGNELVALDLSTDQTPFREDECARVKACGARVLTLDQLEGLKNPNVQCWGGEDDDDGDPPRLWVPNGMYPGTAFTRSIGDSAAEKIGVIAVPEVLVMELTSQHPFFILASDGVFEFLSSQAVVDMVAKYNDAKDACAAIVAESYRLWLQYETRTDDITIIVVHIDDLHDVEMAPESKQRDSHMMHIMSGVKSPVRTSREAYKNRRVTRHDQSRARARAIEASLEQDEPWVSSLEPHAKTLEEEAQIKHALQGNFLFQSLTEKQRHTLCELMELGEVNAGDIVIRQGSEGDVFYIVESGEFEVLVSQNGPGADHNLGTVVHHYDAHSSPCFGELALMYNKPREATVRAVTNGGLWVLEREAFRYVLLMKYLNRASFKILRSVEIFSKLSLSHLHSLAEALNEVSFAPGETIVEKDEKLDTFYIVTEGHVEVADNEDDVLEDFQLPRASLEWTGERCAFVEGDNHSGGKREVRSFGEWVLLDSPARSISVIALDYVDCWTLTRKALEAAVGPLNLIIREDMKHLERMSALKELQLAEVDERAFERITLKDLEWQESVYSTDCCEVGVVLCKKSGAPSFQALVFLSLHPVPRLVLAEDVVSMKRYHRRKVQRLGREGQVLLERSLFKQLRPSPFVPHLLATPIDNDSVALVLNCVLAGPLEILLHAPLDEDSTRYLAASVVLAVELLHKDGVVYRGISPDVVMVDRKGGVQLVDFRFAKQMTDERTFTVCGMADFLAPELIKGEGHGLASDWWAVGVLVYFMLQNQLPFGSWRDSELDIFAKIAGRQLSFPSNFSSEVVDLIDKLLVVDTSKRLGCGSQGTNAIKEHAWFRAIDWDDLLEGRFEVPAEIMLRLQVALEYLPADDTYQVFDLQPDEDNPPWLQGW